MTGVTEWVRIALNELGDDAPDVKVKAYILKKSPTVPESQISLVLRKLRGKTIPAEKGDSGTIQI